jgi:ketosteroid isomerase-like protein
MSTEDNKKIVIEYMQAVVTNNLARQLELIGPDYTLGIVGDYPMAGRKTMADLMQFAQESQAQLEQFAGPMTQNIGAMTAEDDRVCVEVENIRPLKDGRTFHQFYHMLYRVKDGKIVSSTEYHDTLHLYRLFDMPAFRGPAQERKNVYFDVSHTFSSNP